MNLHLLKKHRILVSHQNQKVTLNCKCGANLGKWDDDPVLINDVHLMHLSFVQMGE